MANDPTPDPTRWWLLWLFATIVLPVASGWLSIFLVSWLSIDGSKCLFVIPLMAVVCFWMLCFTSEKAIAPRKGALLALLIIGGLALQISTGLFGCLVRFVH